MSTWDIEVKGLDAVVAKLEGYRSKLSNIEVEALQKIGDEILAESNTLVPVLTGLLRDSGRVRVEQGKGGTATVSVNYGVDVPLPDNYALPVHERLDVAHVNGQAKFLETAYLNQLPAIPERYLQYLREALGD